MNLGIEVSESVGFSVVGVTGELDVATAPQLREALIDLADNNKVNVAINLLDVGFMDSSGLGVLVTALKRMRGLGGDVSLICTNPQILQVLDITNLDSVFRIYASVDALPAAS